jgi:hypothetical protein
LNFTKLHAGTFSSMQFAFKILFTLFTFLCLFIYFSITNFFFYFNTHTKHFISNSQIYHYSYNLIYHFPLFFIILTIIIINDITRGLQIYLKLKSFSISSELPIMRKLRKN